MESQCLILRLGYTSCEVCRASWKLLWMAHWRRVNLDIQKKKSDRVWYFKDKLWIVVIALFCGFRRVIK